MQIKSKSKKIFFRFNLCCSSIVTEDDFVEFMRLPVLNKFLYPLVIPEPKRRFQPILVKESERYTLECIPDFPNDEEKIQINGDYVWGNWRTLSYPLLGDKCEITLFIMPPLRINLMIKIDPMVAIEVKIDDLILLLHESVAILNPASVQISRDFTYRDDKNSSFIKVGVDTIGLVRPPLYRSFALFVGWINYFNASMVEVIGKEKFKTLSEVAEVSPFHDGFKVRAVEGEFDPYNLEHLERLSIIRNTLELDKIVTNKYSLVGE
jgi:hypothetical protein